MKGDEFIREVDEELQREKLLALWKRWGNLIIALGIAWVLGTAGWVGWQQWQESQAKAEAARFGAAERLATTAGPSEATAALLDFAATAPEGFAAVARLQAAAHAAGVDDEARTRTALEAVAGDSDADPLLRDLASLTLASRQLDTADPQEVIRRLEPLTASGAPWRHQARQLLALAHLKAGNSAKADEVLRQLAGDPMAPLAAQRRADELRRTIGVATGSASS